MNTLRQATNFRIALINALFVFAFLGSPTLLADSPDSNGKKEDYVPPVPKSSGTLNSSYGNAPDTLNPILASDTTSESIHNRTIESFATRSYENPSEFIPKLARKWEVSDDGLTYTIHLREDAKFHPIKKPDGSFIRPGNVTAYDAKFSYEVIMNPGVTAGNLRSYFKRIQSFEPIDDYTIKVKWKEPYFNAKGVTLGFLPIIPEDVYAYDKNGEILSHDYTSDDFAEQFNEHWANSKVAGTGPYRLKKWERDQAFVLERFEDYYGQKPFFDKVVYKKITENITRYREFMAGNLTRIGMPQNIFMNKFQKSDKLKNGEMVEEKYDFPSYRYIGWNMRKALFKDKKVRKAMTHAVPRKQIIDDVLQGQARITTGPFFFKREAYNDSIDPYEYNLDRARKLLKEAGWKDRDDDGVREKTIDDETVEFKFTLLHYADSSIYRRIGKILSDRMSQIGVSLEPAPTKWNSFLTKLKNRNFEACLLGWAMSFVSDPYQIWHSSQATAKGGSNHVGWMHDETDKLIKKIRKTMDREKRMKLYHRFHEILHENQPYTFLWTSKELAGHQSKLHGVGEPAPSRIKHYSIRPCVDMHEWFYPAASQSPEKRKQYWKEYHEKREKGEVVSVSKGEEETKSKEKKGPNTLLILAAGGFLLVVLIFGFKMMIGGSRS